jgi:CheY-like chemotaxis protein
VEDALRRADGVRREAEEALRRSEEERREVAGARSLARLAEAPADVPAAPPRIAEVPRGPPAVLLAEDDDVSIAATRRALERAGYRVIAAGDGRRALAACESAGGVDVVVADVGLLGMGGKELADRILARWPATRVVLTAGSAHDVLGEEPGGFPFLAKPYSPGALAAKVRDLLAPPVERKAG